MWSCISWLSFFFCSLKSSWTRSCLRMHEGKYLHGFTGSLEVLSQTSNLIWRNHWEVCVGRTVTFSDSLWAGFKIQTFVWLSDEVAAWAHHAVRLHCCSLHAQSANIAAKSYRARQKVTEHHGNTKLVVRGWRSVWGWRSSGHEAGDKFRPWSPDGAFRCRLTPHVFELNRRQLQNWVSPQTHSHR